MSSSQNGWALLKQEETFRWDLPLRKGAKRHLILKPGDAGFVLAHFALWYHERVEPINLGVWDDWGWAARMIRGSITFISNHESGTAMDLNATKHPLGVIGTLKFWLTKPKRKGIRRFERKELAEQRIRRVLKRTYWNAIRGGLDYVHRKDEMHYEVDASVNAIHMLAKRLRRTRRGKRIIAMNPGYKF